MMFVLNVYLHTIFMKILAVVWLVVQLKVIMKRLLVDHCIAINAVNYNAKSVLQIVVANAIWIIICMKTRAAVYIAIRSMVTMI